MAQLQTYKELLSTPEGPVEWTVKPLIADGDCAVVYGEWGSMKSYWLLHLALALATGQSNMGGLILTKPRKVLYVDEEMGERKTRRRIRRLALGMGLAPDAEIPLRVLSKSGVTFTLPSLTKLTVTMKGSGYTPGDVVIFESFRRGLLGSENDQEDVSKFWDAAKVLTQAGYTVIISHHMRKPTGGRLRDKASGSTDVLAGADNAIAIERQPNSTTIVLTQEKNREEAEYAPFAVTFSFDGESGPISVSYGNTVPAKQAKQAPEVKILAYLKSQPDHKAQTGKLVGDLDLAHSTAHDALKRLESKGLVEHEHGLWSVTEMEDG